MISSGESHFYMWYSGSSHCLHSGPSGRQGVFGIGRNGPAWPWIETIAGLSFWVWYRILRAYPKRSICLSAGWVWTVQKKWFWVWQTWKHSWLRDRCLRWLVGGTWDSRPVFGPVWSRIPPFRFAKWLCSGGRDSVRFDRCPLSWFLSSCVSMVEFLWNIKAVGLQNET